ncbi:MAG: ATP-binding protein [Gammaproteobacteria bacterium]|nr:ATP-binding protein [Gammaproteobacteria bacterium]
MNNWDIRKQIIALALLPLLVVATVLTGYFTRSQLNYISESAVRHGTIVTHQLAPVSEYAVFSGNIDSLTPIFQNILADEDIIEIKLIDAGNKLLTSVNDYNYSQERKSLWHKLASEELTVFREPIKTQTVNINLLEDSNSNTGNEEEVIGYIELTVSSLNINAKKLQTSFEGGLLTLIVLLASIIVALKLSRKIFTPVNILTSTVKKISSGDYKIRINQQTPGDLGILESCVNIMTEELQSSREDLETRIHESTRELHETMEELEVRNIELDIARTNAMRANKAKTEFLAHMSHELRTPLGGILGFSELLESSNLEPQQRDYSETIKKSANNLLHIIDDVLDLSKIESGKLEINFSEFNPIDAVEDVIDLLAPIAYDKNIELFYRVDETAPCLINSDITRVRQILINLIGNAIKFTEKGYVSLHVSSNQKSGSLSTLCFSVTDTGIGMNPSQQERLFNAFTQADGSIEKKFGGTGLGLVISMKLAKLIHGSISFESHLNKGSTFRLDITTEVRTFERVINPVLNGKKICLIDTCKICTEGILTMIDSWGAITSHHREIPETVSGYDLIIVSVCRADMHENKIRSFIPKCNTNIPLFAIASTRSHKDLADIKNYGFNDAVFRSSKYESIRLSVLKLIDGDMKLTVPTETLPSKSFNWSGLNILVVDDNDINLKLAEIVLMKNGANVITASNGHKSIDIAYNTNFDLIFMDLQMPDMDGYETSKLIRSKVRNDTTVIIALTANAMVTKQSQQIEQYGIDEILIKPVTEISIQSMIDKWLLKKPQQQQHIKQTTHNIEIFSKSDALELAAGNTQLANELTSMLINELPEHLRHIDEAVSHNDSARLKQQVHKLHGATRCCGALALRNATAQLELDIDKGAQEKLGSLTHPLISEISRLLNADHSELII